ncbi:MAG: hypothetical protein JSS87_10130 [Acidobacteria bacterium]|nr:hypothetical protein [Acidobacteriota bacterium]
MMLCAPAAIAQQAASPSDLAEAPSAVRAASAAQGNTQQKFVPHAFWDHKNKVLFAVSLTGQAADAITTQRGLSHGRREVNPIARPFVQQGWGGQIGLAVIVNGAQLGVMYLAHRRGHHRVERVLPVVVGLASGAAAYSNLQLEH